MQKTKKAKVEVQNAPLVVSAIMPTIKKTGLIDVKYRDGKIHEMHPDLAKKMVTAKVAEYV